jgi:hypothetical protein
VTPVEPGTLLPLNRVWDPARPLLLPERLAVGRDLDDIVLSFSSGKFEGGQRAGRQEPVMRCAPYAMRSSSITVAGDIAKESESHTWCSSTGRAQHNAGSSIGTDGVITDYILGDFADASR